MIIADALFGKLVDKVARFECHPNTLLSGHRIENPRLHGRNLRRGVEGNHKVIVACCRGRKVVGRMPASLRPQQGFDNWSQLVLRRNTPQQNAYIARAVEPGGYAPIYVAQSDRALVGARDV